MRAFLTHPVTFYVTLAIPLIYLFPIAKPGLLVGFPLVALGTWIQRTFGGKS